MGYVTAQGLASSGLDLDRALGIHLTSNHYPPLPNALVPVAKRVIEKARRGEWDREVRLPPGVSYRGSRLASVSACVRAWHLDAFINDGE